MLAAEGYCMYHKRYMHSDEVKVKSCRCKKNTKKKDVGTILN